MADLEPIVGRYLRLTLGGRAHRVYFEEAGQGIPLVCLHTAGSDGRQFRHLMADEAVTRHYRVIAFDMPWHGKSHLLTGEYDFSCTPDDTRATAETIPGARLTIMQEIGHFPMSEHPEQFRKYLLPVLDEIRGLAR